VYFVWVTKVVGVFVRFLQDFNQHIQLDKRRYIFSTLLMLKLLTISALLLGIDLTTVLCGNIETCIPLGL
jgi:hypothetical protein